MTTEKSADDAVLEGLFSSGRDRGADFAAPKDEPEVQEPEPKAEQAEPEKPEVTEEPKDDSKPQGYRDPSTGRFVPLKELTTEREKRQEEARLRTIAEENARRYQSELEAMQRRFQAAQNPPPPPPDPLMDPEGAFSHLQQTFEQKLLNQTLHFSEGRARDKFGDEVVNAALQAAQQANVTQHFIHRPDAYADLVKWHKSQLNRQRVGDDVDAFEKRIREEERQKTIEDLKNGRVSVMPGQTPQQPQRFPGSLTDATASGPQGAQPVSDEAMAAGMFSSGRKRR